MNIVDARGLDCPKPVIKAKELVEKGCADLSVLVDNDIASSNVTRYLEGQGFSVERKDNDSGILLEAHRAENSAAASASPSLETYAVLFTSETLGAESCGLGEVLMKAYLGTLLQNSQLPAAVALMNTAVRMACGDASTSDSLAELERKGVRILVCGTCTKHFGITDDIRAGVISNMFEITEAVFGTKKPIVLG